MPQQPTTQHETWALLLVFSAPIVVADILDRTWCRLTTTDFELITDLPEPRAKALLIDLQRFREVATVLMGKQPAEELPLKTIVFRYRRDFRKLTKSDRLLGLMQPSLHRNTLVIGPTDSGHDIERTAYHEYTHHLLKSAPDVRYPIWYEEGLARYLATVEMEADRAVVGKLSGRMVRYVFERGAIPLSKVLRERDVMDWAPSNLSVFYDKAWLLVHYLHLSHDLGLPDRRQALSGFIRRLNDGENTDDAFVASFEMTYAGMERKLERYCERRRLPTIELALSPAGASPVADQTCTVPVDVDYELAMVAAKLNPGFAEKVFRDMLEANPRDARALTGLSLTYARQGDGELARHHAERAVRIDPDDVSAKIQLANVMMDECVIALDASCSVRWREAAQLYREAIGAAPTRRDAVYGLGLAYLHMGRPGEALNYLRVAHDHAPWESHISFYLGETHRLMGNDSSARRHLNDAMNWAPEHAWRVRAEMALAKIDVRTFAAAQGAR